MRKDHQASTDSVLSFFKGWVWRRHVRSRHIKNQDKYLFRRLLKGFAVYRKDIWTLRKEWL